MAYIVTATADPSTPDAVLYGDAERVHATREAAQEVADELNADAVWGPNGDQTPAEVGFQYIVESE